MEIYKKILNNEESICVLGLGYVGIPLAVAFDRIANVIGFDINQRKIELYQSGIDSTNEVGDAAIQKSTIFFTSAASQLKKAKFHIVAVPTPINQDKTPDLSPIIDVTTILGDNLMPNSIVVYESTVYPGVTEDICIPILEKRSGLKCGEDFKVGYSPERINPSDKVHRLENITKIVSGIDESALEEIANVYSMIIEAGVHRVSSIKVAEAAKVVENSQRDINIAFVNELAMVFERMNIDTNEVIEAMNTKWNALGFRPGLVGGHCIGVDPYYFVYQAEKLGYHSQIVAAGRKVNDEMGAFIAEVLVKKIIQVNKRVKEAKVAVLGITFKENCGDIRNSKVADIVKKLNEFGINPIISDPLAEAEEVKKEYNLTLIPLKKIKNVDAIVIAVAHSDYQKLTSEEIDEFFHKCELNEKIIIDVKGIYCKNKTIKDNYCYWCL